MTEPNRGHLVNVEGVDADGETVEGTALTGLPLEWRDMTNDERRLVSELDRKRRRRVDQIKRRERADLDGWRNSYRTVEADIDTSPGMADAYRVVAVVDQVIERMARTKTRHALRLAQERNRGSVMAEEIHMAACDAVATTIANTEDRTTAELIKAAKHLANVPAWLPRVRDIDQFDPATPKGTLWLLTVIKRRVIDEIKAWLRANPVVEDLAHVDTISRQLNGDDPMFDRAAADGAFKILGSRFPAPGGIDRAHLAWLIAEAITERGLDPIVEVLIADSVQLGVDEHGKPVMGSPLDVNGMIKWGPLAPLLWRAAGLPAVLFDKLSKSRRAEAAKTIVDEHFRTCDCDNERCPGWLIHGIRLAAARLAEPTDSMPREQLVYAAQYVDLNTLPAILSGDWANSVG